MPPDKIIASIVGIFTTITLIFGVVRYFITLGNKLDTIIGDMKEFKLQQKKQWEKIDRAKDEIRIEREKRIKIENDVDHYKEIVKELKNTNRFRLAANGPELIGVGGEE